MGYTREFEIDRSESLEYVFSLCSDAPYERESKQFGVYDEVLVISEESVDFSRLNSGACAFLRDHDPEKVLGVIVKAWIDGNKVKCKVKFSDREDVQEVVRDIQAGIMTGQKNCLVFTTETMEQIVNQCKEIAVNYDI